MSNEYFYQNWENFHVVDNMLELLPFEEVQTTSTNPVHCDYTTILQFDPNNQPLDVSQFHVSAGNELATGQSVVFYEQVEQPQPHFHPEPQLQLQAELQPHAQPQPHSQEQHQDPKLQHQPELGQQLHLPFQKPRSKTQPHPEAQNQDQPKHQPQRQLGQPYFLFEEQPKFESQPRNQNQPQVELPQLHPEAQNQHQPKHQPQLGQPYFLFEEQPKFESRPQHQYQPQVELPQFQLPTLQQTQANHEAQSKFQPQQQFHVSFEVPQTNYTVVDTGPVSSTRTISKATPIFKNIKGVVGQTKSEILNESKGSSPISVADVTTPPAATTPPETECQSTKDALGNFTSNATGVPNERPGSVKQPHMDREHSKQRAKLPRIELLADEDDGLTCRICLQSFWFKSALRNHMKSSHFVYDPDKYEKLDRERKIIRIREEQTNEILSQRKRIVESYLKVGSLKAIGEVENARKTPSFQFRDGAFICDACQEEFTSGPEMVVHWRNHLKAKKFQKGLGAQKHDSSRESHMGKQIEGGVNGQEPDSSDGDGLENLGKGKKPKWNAFLLWSTKRRKEIHKEKGNWSFNEVAKAISSEWKKVSLEKKKRYKIQADQLNAALVKKIFKSKPLGQDLDIDWRASENPDFKPKFSKPILLKIRKEPDDNEHKQRSKRQRKKKK